MAETSAQTPAGGIDTAGLIDKILSQNKQDLGSLATKALTPIPGGHATQLPLTLQPRDKDFHGGAMIPHEPGVDVVGKGNAKDVGIGNAVIGVTNLLASSKNALDNKKRTEISSATQQLLTAQSAYDQAKIAYTNNPQDAGAKAAMERNQGVMNGILSNEKTRKAIAKGMNIDFTDPSANDTLEHQGVAQGKEQAKQHQDYASQFNEKTPTTMIPNDPAIAQYRAAVEQQKVNNESVKAIIPWISAQLKAASADKRTQGILDAAKIKEVGAIAIQQAKDHASWDRTQAQINGRKDLASDQNMYKLGQIAAEGNKDLQVYQEKLQFTANDPMKLLKGYNDFQTKGAATIAKLTSTISTLELNKAAALKAAQGGQKDQIEKSFDDQINLVKSTISSYNNVIKSNTDMYKQYAGIGGGVDQPNGTGKSGTLDSADTYLNQLNDDEVEPDSDDSDE
jgi:hypothetical protein